MTKRLACDELMRALADLDDQYDPEARMIRRPFSSPGYHTTLSGGWVHPTRESLSYALALLDSGKPDPRERALIILDRVLALQDNDPESRTYGIWPWFAEEPLARMSPPDWNWADFCGTSLIQIAMDHSTQLPGKMKERLDQAVLHAARSIQRRNMGPHYTNIALMGTYVTYTTGEFYQLDDLLDYARGRLQRFYAYTQDEGSFTEFNSPTYTVVALHVLGRMRRDIRDPGAHPLLDWLYDLAWADVARHFHPPTRQWAGPHSRCYSTLLRPGTLAFLQHALGDRVSLLDPEQIPPDIEACRLSTPCPEQYVPFFAGLEEPREDVRVYHRGSELYPRIVGRAYLDRTVAVSSMNRGDLWNQRRPLVAYWGTGDHPIALQLRCLHDGYDFSSALVFTRQAGPYVLAGVVFATDYGDRHISLDPVRDQAIIAQDLRLSFQIIHPPSGWALPDSLELGTAQSWTVGNASLALHIAWAACGDGSPYGQTRQEGGDGCLDVVLYHGHEQRIPLGAMESAAIVFGLQITPAEEDTLLPSVDVSQSEEMLEARWDTPRGTIGLSIPVQPGPMADIERLAQGIDDA